MNSALGGCGWLLMLFLGGCVGRVTAPPLVAEPSGETPGVAATPLPPRQEAPTQAASSTPCAVRIIAVGDVQLGTAWPPEQEALPPEQGRTLFAAVRDVLRSGDVTFGNLETALADSGESEKCSQLLSTTRGAKRGVDNLVDKRAAQQVMPRQASAPQVVDNPVDKVVGKRHARGPGGAAPAGGVAGAVKRCFAFRAPTFFAAVLKQAGFSVLSLANNHTGDFGATGRQATRRALDEAGLLYSGPVGDVARWQWRNLRLALIAFAAGDGLYRIQDLVAARQLIADLKKAHDIVIVSFHGGAEGLAANRVLRQAEKFYGEDRGDVYAFAHTMVDAGADLVLGHGPHVLRGMEVYKERLIAYSLGNFSSWKGFNLRDALGQSVILEASLGPDGRLWRAQLHPVVLKDEGIPTPDPSGMGTALVRALSQQDFGTALFDEMGLYEAQGTAASSCGVAP